MLQDFVGGINRHRCHENIANDKCRRFIYLPFLPRETPASPVYLLVPRSRTFKVFGIDAVSRKGAAYTYTI